MRLSHHDRSVGQVPSLRHWRPCVRTNPVAIVRRGLAMYEPTISPPPGLGWRRLLARTVLWFERLLPALLPAARVAGVFLCLALLDLLPMLPWWLHAVVLGASGAAIVALLW